MEKATNGQFREFFGKLIVKVNDEKIAITEANKLGIPVVSFVDTNTNPKGVDYVIPANDDSVKSLKMLLDIIAEAVNLATSDYHKNQVKVIAPVEEKKKTKTMHKITQDGETSEETVEAAEEVNEIKTEG